jgi:DNA repair protein RadA/Sms
LKEAAKLGFKRAIVPKGQIYPDDTGLEIVPVGKVIDAIIAAIPQQRPFNERVAFDEETEPEEN